LAHRYNLPRRLLRRRGAIGGSCHERVSVPHPHRPFDDRLGPKSAERPDPGDRRQGRGGGRRPPALACPTGSAAFRIGGMTEVGGPNPSRILILDDDLVNRSLIQAILTRADDPSIRHATLREAGSLAEARVILDREDVDLLLLDVHLPDGLGLTLATELGRERADRPAILALTASVV